MVDKFVSVDWLNNHLNDNNLIILDASADFDNDHTISYAQHFDLANTFSDEKSSYPNTLPSQAKFQKEARKLGINNDSSIVVFDNKGIFYSPRVWWMFTTMGFKNIAVLDGGLPEWKNKGYPTAISNNRNVQIGDFTAHFNPTALKNYDEILKNRKSCDFQLIDARSKGRFDGIAPEPRPHLKSGHIENSINLPYTTVLENGKYKSEEKLNNIFRNLNLTQKPIVFTCGSGVTACIILFALELISNREKSVYDGSWTEWAEKQELFI
ncbi:sulfurtransferase [Dokdonia sp. Hel_I_53]|uniref:sulfurtransferase n=1 Tax=Dokdonia sp. Hel_I_53 TaxID=1566287 RepID=UPI00119A8C3A|nr:sulfurtransferase [Dokdonia sp. Hel_I_53]TVZ53038.1 thiosulfate/3-mercaptopyruvate sulfurtransferase [Dokdonia sp. Hel_I_53]